MKKGSTPTFSFDLFGQNIEDIIEIEITFSQEGFPIVKKHKEDCEIVNNSFSVTLTQEETFLFDGERADVQVRIKKANETVLSSDIVSIKIEESLSNEVL